MTPMIRFLMPILILATCIRAEEAAEHKATQLTPVCGTPKMEGAVADAEGNFYFCNMAMEDMNVREQGNIGIIPAGESEPTEFVRLPKGLRGNGLRIGPGGILYMADQLGGTLVTIDIATKEVKVLHDFGFSNKKWNNTPNDVAITSDGKRLFVSCMANGIWTLDTEGNDVKKVSGKYTNGLEVSPDDKTLYTANTFYAIGADGGLTPNDVSPKLPSEGYAYTDGLRADAEGNVYISRAGKRGQKSGAVHVVSPDGELLRNIVAPFSRVHNVGFGGPEGKTLYLICPGNNGFVATYENDTPGANFERVKGW